MTNSGSSTAHSIAVNAITNARQNTRQYRFMMEQDDSIDEDAIFVNPNNSDHPQRKAHAALMDYHEEVNQPEYVQKVNEIWQEKLKDEAGHDLTIEVPKHDRIKRTVEDPTDVGKIVPDRDEIETKTESISLEVLGHRWSGRSVMIEVHSDLPYYDTTDQVQQVRLWLPPKVIKAAYSQLNSVLSRISLLAKTDAPVEHDPDPI